MDSNPHTDVHIGGVADKSDLSAGDCPLLISYDMAPCESAGELPLGNSSKAKTETDSRLVEVSGSEWRRSTAKTADRSPFRSSWIPSSPLLNVMRR